MQTHKRGAGAREAAMVDSDQGKGTAEGFQQLDEAVVQLKTKIDSGAGRLKDGIGNAVNQIESAIEAADRVVEHVLKAFDESAKGTSDFAESAGLVAEKLERPISYIRRHPMQGLAGALVMGAAFGLLFRRQESGEGRTRLRSILGG